MTPSPQPDYFPIEGHLQLYDPKGNSFTLERAALSVTQVDDHVIDCSLMMVVDSSLYQRIEVNHLFSLRPELKGPAIGWAIAPDQPITLTLRLHPEWLPRMAEHGKTGSVVAAYMQHLSHNQSQDRLVQTESWLALSVSQETETGECGYRTFWDYLGTFNPHDESSSDVSLTQSLGQFIQDSLQATVQDEIAQTTAELQGDLADFTQRLSGAGLPLMNQQGLAEVMQSLTDLFSQNNRSDESVGNLLAIYERVQAFFNTDGWPVIEVAPATVLQVTFQGDNGQWLCYAQIQEDNRQLVFYSILPTHVSEEKHMAIAQFITRANNGLALGNFELDHADGTIRFKTSLRSPNTDVSVDVIQDVVYTNVLTVDQYLPGILQVLHSNTEPDLAIAHIEAKY